MGSMIAAGRESNMTLSSIVELSTTLTAKYTASQGSQLPERKIVCAQALREYLHGYFTAAAAL